MKIINKETFAPIIDIVVGAGKIAIKYFNRQTSRVEYSLKNDNSPVTIADIEINNFLKERLNILYPDIKIFSEEENSDRNKAALLGEEKLFIIDPIDGTSAFIKGSDEFTINISLKIKQTLVFSIIYAPVLDVLYCADQNKLYKYSNISNSRLRKKQEISFSKNYSDSSKIKIIATRRKDELEEIQKKFRNSKFEIDYLNISSSIKFCYLAEGKADIYFRMAKIKLWDVAAGFHITNIAGLEVRNLDGVNIMEHFLDYSYLEKIQNDNFRIDEFIIKSSSLLIDY